MPDNTIFKLKERPSQYVILFFIFFIVWKKYLESRP